MDVTTMLFGCLGHSPRLQEYTHKLHALGYDTPQMLTDLSPSVLADSGFAEAHIKRIIRTVKQRPSITTPLNTGIPGVLQSFSSPTGSRLCAFESGASSCTCYIIFVGGTAERLLACPYVQLLSHSSSKAHWILVQPLLSSGGSDRIGRHSSELEALILHLLARNAKAVALVAHGSGCQPVMQLMKTAHARVRGVVRAVVLQAAPSSCFQTLGSEVAYLSTTMQRSMPGTATHKGLLAMVALSVYGQPHDQHKDRQKRLAQLLTDLDQVLPEAKIVELLSNADLSVPPDGIAQSEFIEQLLEVCEEATLDLKHPIEALDHKTWLDMLAVALTVILACTLFGLGPGSAELSLSGLLYVGHYRVLLLCLCLCLCLCLYL